MPEEPRQYLNYYGGPAVESQQHQYDVHSVVQPSILHDYDRDQGHHVHPERSHRRIVTDVHAVNRAPYQPLQERNPMDRYTEYPIPSSSIYNQPPTYGPDLPGVINTSASVNRGPGDDERTPTSSYRHMESNYPALALTAREQQSDYASVSSPKYECEYCGKGFNRPSSLKVSHSRILLLGEIM